MGAGKTVLIGAIIATEFAMALEYPDADPPFIENALVFAPGLTILESLRELSRIPFEHILPPRLFEAFAPSLKLVYTRDGETGIAVIPGSRFNLVVTNTEKIRIQAKPARRARVGAPLAVLFDRTDEERREVANLRLQAVASLPHLGIFSDEAHHTYGRALGTDLKRVLEAGGLAAGAALDRVIAAGGHLDLEDLEARNPGRIVYRIVFSDAHTPAADLTATEQFIVGV
ncbi:MAG: hypothetical protein ACSLFN_15540 [Candidatus Limnocylindrales bacterium]